jgi:hypothetical protein
LINVDKSAIQQAREKKELRRKKKQEEQELKQRVSSLETDISDIKKMLEIVVSKMN